MLRALLPVCAVLVCSCLGGEYGWEPHKEFLFSIQGQDLAGLPQLKQQYAGFQFQGELRVQSHSSRVLLFKLFNMNYAKIHEELTEGWWNGPESSPKNKTKTLPITTSTVIVKLTKSTSPELVIQAGLDDWQVNFIKGVVSNILAFLSENNNVLYGPNSNRPSNIETRDVYSVMEDSVVGRCEVLYEVSQLPRQLGANYSHLCIKQQLWEITKTRNYSNCQLFSEDHVHLPTQDCTPGGANCGHFWTRATVTQMIGCGEKKNLVLLSSVSSSVISTQLHLQNNSQAVINSKLNITLLSAMDLKRKFNAPQNKETLNSLLYSYSTTLKDNGRNSEEEIIDHRIVEDSNRKSNPKNQLKKKIKDSDKSESENPGSRNKRSLKKKNVNKYKTESSDPYNENSDNSRDFISQERSVYEETPNIFKTKNTGGKHKSWQESSEEYGNQPSEEMQLEERWKISGKELKSIPPHQPFNMFTLAHRTSYDLSCLNPKLRQIIADVASDLEEVNILPEKNTMDKLSLAVDICRSLPLDQLTSVSEEVFEVHSGAANIMKNKERKVFRDVITMCGTHPALQLIKGWVERQQVEGEEAAEMIASLPSHIFSPSKFLIQDFFEMVQQITEKDDRQLTITAVLALSNLVRDACVNPLSRQHHFSSIVKPVCADNFAAHIAAWITHRMDSDPQILRVYIQALGNIGSREIIGILNNYAVDPKYSSYIRTSAIFAMRYQVLRKNPEMAPLLMSLYHNYSLPASARIAAAALLVYSNPGLAMWQRLAISTWYEPSRAVAQFVASTFRTMATTKDSLYGHITKSAYLVQPLAKPSRVSVHKPYNMLTSRLSSDLEKIILEQLSWMRFPDFTNLYYRHSSRSSGFSRTNIEASFDAVNTDSLWNAFKELVVSTNDHHNQQSPTAGIERTLVKIREMLDLSQRPEPQLQADIHLKINNMMERMFVIDKDTFRSWAKGGRKNVFESLMSGKSLTYQKADMNSLQISTTTDLGFPVEFIVRNPWIIQAQADLNFTDGEVMVGAAFMYSSQLLSSVSVMSSWDNSAHSAGAYATNFVQLPPFRVALSLDRSMEAVKLTTAYIDQHRLLYFSMQPFTSQRKLKIHQATLLSPDTLPIKLGEAVQMPISWLSRYLNTVYSSEETGRFNAMDFIKQSRIVLGFPMVMANMEARSFETVMNPLHPIVMNFTMGMASKSVGLLEFHSPEKTILGKLFNGFSKAEKSEQNPSKSPDVKLSDTSVLEDKKRPQIIDKVTNTSSTNATTSKSNITEGQIGNKSLSQKETKVYDEAMNIVKPLFGAFQVYSTTYESATGSFNASQINPFDNMINGSCHSYLLEQVLSHIHSGKAVVMGLNMKSTHPEQPTNLAAYLTYAYTLSERASRFGFFMKKELSQTKITAVYEAPVDIVTDLKRRVTDDLQHNFYVDYVQSFGGQNMKASIKARLGVSRASLAQLKASPLLDMCSQLSPQHFDFAMESKCQALQAQARETGFSNITIYYSDNAKFLENMAQEYMNAAKVMLLRTEQMSGQGFNSMTFTFDVDQRTDSINTVITTPVSGISVRRFPLSQIPMSTLVEWAMQDSRPEEFCGISPHRVSTFDGAEFQYKMKSSWHLVTKDCSGQYGISVIAQPASNDSLTIEVNMDDQYTISAAPGPRLSVNDKLQPLDASHALLLISDRNGRVIAHTVFTPDNSIHIQLLRHNLDIVYSRTSLVIRAQQGLQGRLCGLCGSYSNTGMEEFLTAHGSSADSPSEFSASYMLEDSKPNHFQVDN